VEVDVTQFQMLLSAILTNAIDAIADHGRIRV
jgi:signal transduction histidine kinase